MFWDILTIPRVINPNTGCSETQLHRTPDIKFPKEE